jgi:exo-beta-1,3-glucanase (GH17 family)
MEAIRQTKVDLNVYLGIYISEDETIWERQRADTLAIIQEYGVDHISGITVGNEFLLNQANGAATAPAAAVRSITTKVAQFKQDLAGLSLSKTLPVGTADAGSMVSTTLAAGVDYYMANVHPWFGGLNINQAAGWTWEFMEEQVNPSLGTTKGYIAETGWPTNAMTTAALTYQGAVASVANLQTCWSFSG